MCYRPRVFCLVCRATVSQLVHVDVTPPLVCAGQWSPDVQLNRLSVCTIFACTPCLTSYVDISRPRDEAEAKKAVLGYVLPRQRSRAIQGVKWRWSIR